MANRLKTMLSKQKTEAPVEKYCVTSVQKRGGLCLKLAIIGKRNFPDRTILCKPGKVFFIEFKAPNKDLRKSQAWFRRLLLRLGFTVYVAKTKEQVDQILDKEMEAS